MKLEYDDGRVVLYLGDNRGIVPSLPRPASLFGDPPYGINLDTKMGHGRKKENALGLTVKAKIYPKRIIGDNRPFDPAPWLNVADVTCFWGAHVFAHRLPQGRWYVWDKMRAKYGLSFGDGEAAWVSSKKPRPMKIKNLLWNGLMVDGAEKRGLTRWRRTHPAEKPVMLMEWIIGDCAPPRNDPGPLDGHRGHRHRRDPARSCVRRDRNRPRILRNRAPADRSRTGERRAA